MWPFGHSTAAPVAQGGSAYDYSFTRLTDGEPLKLSDYKGQVLLIVNTASKCGFTGQYDGLEKLFQTYKGRGFVVIGVPSNDFGNQEPGSATEIADFCKKNYGVSFPMAGKEVVKGENAHPFYKWVASLSSQPKWNFTKYLIGRDGKLIERFGSMTSPEDRRLADSIEKALSPKP